MMVEMGCQWSLQSQRLEEEEESSRDEVKRQVEVLD
jgi:hypothetical protein